MYCRGIEQVREAKSSTKKKNKAVSFFKKWLRKKILQQSAVEQDYAKREIGLGKL